MCHFCFEVLIIQITSDHKMFMFNYIPGKDIITIKNDLEKIYYDEQKNICIFYFLAITLEKVLYYII